MAIRLPGGAGIAGALGYGADAIGIEADVQDGVHHAGHRLRGAGAHRDQQRIAAAAEGTTDQLLQAGEVGADGVLQTGGPMAAGLVILIAALRRDGEAGRNVEAGLGHVGETGAFAADQMLDLAAAVRLPAAEEVNQQVPPLYSSFHKSSRRYSTICS